MRPVGWVEPLRNPMAWSRRDDGFRCALPILRLLRLPRRIRNTPSCLANLVGHCTGAGGCESTLFLLQCEAVLEQLSWTRRAMDLSIKGVPEEQVTRLRERAKANHRSLQGELRALVEEATGTAPRKL